MTGQIKKYQRKIIGVEKKLGFMYVPAIGQEHLPAETAKISVLLEGDKAVSSLTYNSTHKRIFGLTDWYNKRAIVVGSIVNVEFEGSLMKLSVSSNIELVETEEEDEKTVDL